MNLDRIRTLLLCVLPLSLPLLAACAASPEESAADRDAAEENVGEAAQGLAAACTGTVAGGDLGSLTLTPEGMVLAAGANTRGQLGDGSTTTRSTPEPVVGLSGITAISAGWSSYSLAIKADRTVTSWGANTWGQLGDGTGTDRHTPVPVVGLTDVIAVSAAYLHGLAVKSDGTVWAWGINSSGQLGDGTSLYSRRTPGPVTMPLQDAGPPGPDGMPGPASALRATAVAGGNGFSLALTTDRTVVAWGDNNHGQLGDGTSLDRNPGVVIDGLSDVTAIAAGYESSLALRSDGTVWAWGGNTHGQLGDGTINPRSTPAPVLGLSGVIAVAEGYNSSFAVKSDGTIVAWGANGQGQLGDGTIVDRHAPVPVHLPAGSVAGLVAAGKHHAVAQMSDGRVYAWGDNSAGQLGDGTTLDQRTPEPSGFAQGAACISACPCLDSHQSSFLAQLYGQILAAPSACTLPPDVSMSGDDLLSHGFFGQGPDTLIAGIGNTGARVCTTAKAQAFGLFFFGPSSLPITAQQQQGCFAAMTKAASDVGLTCGAPACVPVTCAQMGAICSAIPDAKAPRCPLCQRS